MEQGSFASDHSGTARASPTGTDAGDYATASARSGLANATGNDVSDVSGMARR